MDIRITANDLKVKGVSMIDSVVEENDSAIITVHGKEKYVVLKIADFNKMREQELDEAIRQSREDIATGRFHADGVDAHIKRARIFFRSKFGLWLEQAGAGARGGQLRVFFLFSCANCVRTTFFCIGYAKIF